MGRRQDDPHDSHVPAGSEGGVQERAEPRGERQSPDNKAGDAPSLRMSLFEGLQGGNAADGYFCNQKTSKSWACGQTNALREGTTSSLTQQ